MPPLVRLATVHPALAHFTIGGLPLVVIGYGLARRRRSEAWTLVGDAALVVTALATVGTAAFGLVSNAVVPWPGGLETWRTLHLAGGIATASLLVALAALRLDARHRGRALAPSVVLAAIAIAAVAGFTGWVGGEVLVFRGGMAVQAAGDGALAPPIVDRDGPPKDFLDAMRGVRASWGSINAELAWMLVQHPRDEGFARIEREARRMSRLAQGLADEPGRDARAKDVLASMSQTIAGDADDIAQAAQKKSLQDIAHAVGEASGHCADCHEEVRWKK